MVESFLLNLETQAWIKGLKLIFRFLLKENRIIFFTFLLLMKVDVVNGKSPLVSITFPNRT